MRPPNSGFFRFSRAPKAGSRIAVCLAVVFGLVGVDAAAAGTTARPAISTTPPSTVSVPHARFQVLSPTLIRTEYAGDDKFENRATFNAVGRNAFSAPARYTSSVRDGLLTITTSALTLHYRVGSGPFTTDHLTVRLKAGPDPVLAAP
ncbi:hypothetical protein ACFW2X_33660 [Streptomyces antibioticus]|uniref:hypothetical protein n=1 Tax=Streptomyces antibioticus TaxID=1890 RepID=UPI003692E031